MQAISGFVVVDRAGEFLAWAAHVEVAVERMRGDPLAHRAERCSDGIVVAFKQARKKTPGMDFEEAVPA